VSEASITSSTTLGRTVVLRGAFAIR
jgi:hypothetical protein